MGVVTMSRNRKELDFEKMSRIVKLSEKVYSIREICEKVGVSKSSVVYTIRKCDNCSKNYDRECT